MVKISANDFMDLLSNPDIKSKFCAIFAESTAAVIENKLAAKLEDLSATIGLLRTELAAKNAIIADIKKDNQNLHGIISKLSATNEDLLQEAKRDNLVFSGLSPSFAEAAAAVHTSIDTDAPIPLSSTIRKVVTFCKDALNLEINESDVSSAYFTKPKASPGRPPAPPLLVVRFVRRTTRDLIMANRRVLKDHNARHNSKFFINEDLTQARRKLFGSARAGVKAGKLTSAWTSAGLVRVKLLAGNNITVHSLEALNNLI